MNWVSLLMLSTALVACGRGKEDEDDGDDAVTQTVPYGDTGGRDNAGTSDGRPVPGVQPGEPGAPGAPGQSGEPGAPGLPGPSGPTGGIALFDAENQQIGIKLHDDVGDVAHVVLSDNRYAMIDRATGELVPLQEFSCLYETNDCSGSCFVQDKRWMNLVLEDPSGSTWVVDRKVADQGAKEVRSFGAIGRECIAAAFATEESYQAGAYALPGGFSLPLSAPLYWALSN